MMWGATSDFFFSPLSLSQLCGLVVSHTVIVTLMLHFIERVETPNEMEVTSSNHFLLSCVDMSKKKKTHILFFYFLIYFA
jgi:hypothetical protein